MYICFSRGKDELISAIKRKFADLLSEEVYLQILDKSWGEGVFIDLIKIYHQSCGDNNGH